MFRDIRKKKNQISTEAAEQLLREARRGILAVNGREGYPYAIPINYYYDREAQKIYFHGARAGHKVEAIRACDKVCFTVYGGETIREEAWAPYLRSVVVFGRCRLLEQSPETMALLKRFAMKYYPEEQLADEEIRQDGAISPQVKESFCRKLQTLEVQRLGELATAMGVLYDKRALAQGEATENGQFEVKITVVDKVEDR